MSFILYAKKQINSFFRAALNIFLFLPYFFSATYLIRTFFSPWKNLSAYNTQPGFSLDELFSRLGFNLISRLVGALARSGLLLSYICIMVFFVAIFPFALLTFVVFIPIRYIVYCLSPKAFQKQKTIHDDFTDKHLINTKNTQKVEEWFKLYYSKTHKDPWWSKKRLFASPPLARDWTYGYTPTIDRYCIDLSKKTKQSYLVDRKSEIEEIETTLSKSQNANIILVGDEGVGRKTIIEALAYKIYEGKISPHLLYKRSLVLDMQKILALSEDNIKRSDIVSNILAEANKAGNIFLVIYDLDLYTSQSTERIDLSSPLNKYAKSSALHILATSTPSNYQQYIYANTKISQLFEKIDIKEVTRSNTIEILLNIALNLESKYKLIIPYESIAQAVDKSNTYISGIPQPEKAIDLLDSACSYVSLKKKGGRVLPDMIDSILQKKTHIPTKLTDALKQKLLNLDEALKQRIIYQNEAIKNISSTLKKSFVVSVERKKPLAAFLFLGPTGVGKTETAKALTQVFFDSDKALIRFDMSLYQSRSDIPKLVGDPITGDPGLLTKSIREKRYGVLLLDEIEKADKNLLNIFLTILDEGYFIDGFGKKVDCKNLIIIATSNAEAAYLFENIGKLDFSLLQSSLVDKLIQDNIFTPEFLNRFDGVIMYKPLTKNILYTIARIKLDSLKQNIYNKHKVTIRVSRPFLERIIRENYDARFGARGLDRTIRNEVEEKIATALLKEEASTGDTINF